MEVLVKDLVVAILDLEVVVQVVLDFILDILVVVLIQVFVQVDLRGIENRCFVITTT